MKKIKALCLILAVLLLLTAPVYAAEEDPSVSMGSHGIDAVNPLGTSEKLLETAKAAILYERNSDTMLYSWNADVQLEPSSMAKIMTALVALENEKLDAILTVTRSALNTIPVGSVSAGLKAGEELTLESLLYCSITASANDATAVIAEEIGGSIGLFVQMMNDKAAQLGCKETNFVNPHGITAEGAYTTARDICRILDAALDNPEFVKLFQADEYVIPATSILGKERKIITTNYMQSTNYTSRFFDKRVTGGKTGSTNAGRCLAVTAQMGDMELIGIVMEAIPTYEVEGIQLDYHGNFEEMAVLLDYADGSYEYRQVFYEGQALTQIPVQNGTNDVVTTTTGAFSTVLPVEVDESKLRWVYVDAIDLKAPIEKGQVVSLAQVWYGDTCLVQTELVAMNSVDVYQPLPDQTHESGDDGFNGKLLLIILGCAAGLAMLVGVVFVIVRRIKNAKLNALRRREKHERRRYR